MTYIPGTGQVSVPKTESVSAKIEPKPELFSAVNVKELKHPTIVEEPEPLWFNQLKYWVAFGSGFSVIFAFFAFFDIKYLLLIPLGPYAGYLSWHIRKWLKRHTSKFDALS